MQRHSIRYAPFIALLALALASCAGPQETPGLGSNPITPDSQPESIQTGDTTRPPDSTATPESTATLGPSLKAAALPRRTPVAVETPATLPTAVAPTLLPAIHATPLNTSMPATTPAPVPTVAPAPTPPTIAAPELSPTPLPRPALSPTPIPSPSESEGFWNQANVGQDGEPIPSCGDSIFTHRVVDTGDATPFFWVEDVYPHEHMVYWTTPRLNEGSFQPAGIPNTEQVQLYAPADIYFMQVWRIVDESYGGGTFEDWKMSTTICNGYRLNFGHVGRPVEEILVEVRKTVSVDWSDCPVSTTEEALVTTRAGSCVWRVFFDPPISAGTPILKSSGYTTGFDLGLELLGLTAEELRQQPSYGYSINPWAYSGGRSVCTLEYFPEPYRTAYLESMESRCGPINQDVPGTAIGVWLPIPPPADGSVPDRGPGTVWQSMGVGGEGLASGLYLFEDWVIESVHRLHIGSQLPDIPAGKYRIETVSGGLVNREWDSVVAGNVHCAELRPQWAVSGWDDTVSGVVLIEVSEDGRTLTIEGSTETQCPEGQYSFSADAHTMYR